MRSPSLLIITLSLLISTHPTSAAPLSPADSLLGLLANPEKRDELHSWLQQATIAQLCDQVGESFRALSPSPGSAPDQEFAWPRWLNLLAAAMQDQPHALIDPEGWPA